MDHQDTSDLSFKVRVDSMRVYFVTYGLGIPQIDLWCNSCRPVAALPFFNLHFLGEVESQLCDLDPEVLSLAVKCLYSLGQRQVIVNINSIPTLIILSRSNISLNDYGKLFVLRIRKLFKLKPSIFLFQILADGLTSRDKATCISFKIKLNK